MYSDVSGFSAWCLQTDPNYFTRRPLPIVEKGRHSIPRYATAIILVVAALVVIWIVFSLAVTRVRRRGNVFKCSHPYQRKNILRVFDEYEARGCGFLNPRAYHSACTTRLASRAWMEPRVPALTYSSELASKGLNGKKKRKANADSKKCLIYENKSVDDCTHFCVGDYEHACTDAKRGKGVNEITCVPEGMQDVRIKMPPPKSDRDPSSILMEKLKRMQMHHLEFVRNTRLLTEEQNGNQIPPVEFARNTSLLTEEENDRQMSPPEFSRDANSPLNDTQRVRQIPPLIINRNNHFSHHISQLIPVVQLRDEPHSGRSQLTTAEDPVTTKGNGSCKHEAI